MRSPITIDADGRPSSPGDAPPYWRNASLSCAVLIAAVMAVYRPDRIDRPASGWVDGYVGLNATIDRMFFAFDVYFTFSGAVLMALIWSCWSGVDAERRSRILVGVVVSFGAGVLSRILQHHMPSHLRPLHDPAMAFHTPGGLVTAPLNTWNSFPSDHVTVFAGLVVVLFTVRSKLAVPAAAWTTLVEFSRIYMGAHYPSDAVGGAALAAVVVWGAQAPPFVAIGRRVAALERSAPSVFYAVAFFVSFQVATLFIEIRGLTGGFSLLNSLH